MREAIVKSAAACRLPKTGVTNTWEVVDVLLCWTNLWHFLRPENIKVFFDNIHGKISVRVMYVVSQIHNMPSVGALT